MPQRTSLFKITLLAYFMCTLFGLIAMRLFYLQINLGDYFFYRGQKNFLRVEVTRPPRGNIVDCKGKLLVTNRPIIHIYWQGSGNKALSMHQKNILESIALITHKDLSSSPYIHQVNNAEKHNKQTLLMRDISFDQLSKIEELYPNHPNIHIKTSFERYYPYKTYACHVLGYLNNYEDQPSGIAGLEKILQNTLRGQEGYVQKTINSVGRSIQQIELLKEQQGATTRTTIDIELQDICERIFPIQYAGTMILMDPKDGALLALISRPNFDPSQFLRPISLYQWQELQENSPLLNRAFNASYPPGSIFKLVSVSAALEHNIVTPSDTFLCKGYKICGKRKYWCHNHFGHGLLDTRQSVAYSCNILFFEIAQKMDVDLLADYAFKFGLGRKTHIPFQEQSGLVPTKQWKNQTLREAFWPGEKLSLSIGQSFLLVTPIQVARMISSIFTGYLTNPRILHDQPIQQQPLAIMPETRRFLQKSMKSAVTQGTGKRVSKIKDLRIYAKTSTAQTSRLEKRIMGTEYWEHGWFVAYFQYKDNPALTVVIQLEHAGSAQIATSIARNFLVEYKKWADQSYSPRLHLF